MKIEKAGSKVVLFVLKSKSPVTMVKSFKIGNLKIKSFSNLIKRIKTTSIRLSGTYSTLFQFYYLKLALEGC